MPPPVDCELSDMVWLIRWLGVSVVYLFLAFHSRVYISTAVAGIVELALCLVENHRQGGFDLVHLLCRFLQSFP